MHLQIKSSIFFMVLTIFELCSSVPNLPIESYSLKNNKLTENSKQLLRNDDDDIKFSDKSATKQLNDRSMIDQSRTNDIDHPNFLLTNYMSDGEIERRIHFNGITAKETLVSNFRYVFFFLS